MRRKVLTVVVLIVALVFNTALAFAGTSVSRYTEKSYNHNEKFDDRIMVNGLDVSTYQNDIDWQQAKADGIDFAIIRVGYRGYGSEGKLNPDDYYVKNLEGARKAGLLVGIYFFSQAVTELEAIAEAEYAVELLHEAGVYDLDLPIFMDYEFAGGTSGRLNKAKLSKATMTANAVAFCERVEALGYEPGIYANLNFLNKTIDGETLGQSYPIWIAQYNTYCEYEHDYDYWQYASSGTVNGIKGRNDCNFWYLEKAATPSSMFSLADAQGSVTGTSVFTYSPGTVYQPKVTIYHSGRMLTENVDYTVKYINNTQAGLGYAYVQGMGLYTDYCLVPFTIQPMPSLSGVVIEKIADTVYTGSEQKPSGIVIKDTRGDVLVNGLDYTYEVFNAVNAGTANIAVTFMGNYTGTMSSSYKIAKAEQAITIADVRTEVGYDQEDYNLGVSLAFPEAEVKYSSSDKDVVKVSKDGTVSVIGQGTATIKVKAEETANVKAAEKSFDITVTKPIQTVTTKYGKYNKTMLNSSFNIVGVKTDGGGKISYESSDENVVTVSSKGKVTIVGPGTAVITVKAAESETHAAGSKEITVNVTKAVQTVTSGYTNYKRNDLDKMFSISPKTDGDGELTIVSSDETVATIDNKGRVTVMGPGVVQFTVTAAETDKYLAGEKIVTLTVNGFETEEEREEKKAAIIEAVENTKITKMKATALTKKVRIDWDKSSSKYGVDYYRVWRSYKKSSGYVKILKTTDSSKKYCINTKNVKPDTKYWYRVCGVRMVDGEEIRTQYGKISATTKK